MVNTCKISHFVFLPTVLFDTVIKLLSNSLHLPSGCETKFLTGTQQEILLFKVQDDTDNVSDYINSLVKVIDTEKLNARL
jgi:hypothetical protein